MFTIKMTLKTIFYLENWRTCKYLFTLMQNRLKMARRLAVVLYSATVRGSGA